MTDEWVEHGQKISSAEELREYVTRIRAEVSAMQSGLSRAAFGALTGRAWIDSLGKRLSVQDMLHEHLEMTVTPPGLAAKDAVYRQSLATLLAALETVDRATLAAWLADVSAQDPNRTA